MDDQLDEAGNIIQRGLGKVAGALGAVAGVPAGMARAFKSGKAQGADAIGGPASEPAAPEAVAPAEPAAIKQQIAQKKTEIASLEKQLTDASTSTVGDKARSVGNAAAGAINAATNALKAGQNAGTSMQSLAQLPDSDTRSVKIKDAQGQEHAYKKVGQQWVDSENKPVNAAQSAMLDRQADQQSALSKPTAAAQPAATPQEPVKIGGQTLDPTNPADKKIIDQIQKQQASAPAEPDSPPAQATAAAAPATANPAVAQSPEEIRKAKQATAAKTAQDQLAANPAPAKQPAAVWKNNRAPAGTPASTSPQAAAATVQGQTAPNFGQPSPGYSSVKMNATTGAPQPAPQPTTGAKAVPVQQPTAAPVQNKKQPQMAGTDFSAMLARKAKIRL